MHYTFARVKSQCILAILSRFADVQQNDFAFREANKSPREDGSVTKIGVGKHMDVELRFALRYTTIVVHGQVQLLQ